LLACGAEHVAVLAHPAWVGDLTRRVNFTLYNAIVTMRKSDRVVPGLKRSPGANIRPARPDDIPAIAENDRASFDTVWQHSAASLAHILRHVSHFVVAEMGERVVGHAFSDIYGGHGHLIRLVVDPAYQRRGIGEQLLRESLLYQRDVEAYPFTLNTQIDNASSQALYRRHGYQLTGEPVRVMHCALRET
jgi:ribosomal protein S18 acetylase RimI-like enzyme